MRLLVSILLLAVSALMSATPYIVVIDAGHGGHDGGAPGAKNLEKEVNLKVALALGKQLKKDFRDRVKVIYTRDDDTFVTLLGRAQIANNNNADIFVSIHSNSIGDASRRDKVKGSSVYVRGFASSKKASEVAARENSVLQLEDKTKINTSSEASVLNELIWNKNLEKSITLASKILDRLVATAGRSRGQVEQNDLAVLKRTDMPAVLIELDYICNPTMEKFMASDEGQRLMAKGIAEGIAEYFSADKGLHATAPSKNKNNKPVSNNKAEDGQKTDKKTDGRPIYKIQFMTSSRPIKSSSDKMKGLTDSEYYIENNIYKYTIGNFSSQEESLRELKKIKKIFPDAFVIKTVDGKRVR